MMHRFIMPVLAAAAGAWLIGDSHAAEEAAGTATEGEAFRVAQAEPELSERIYRYLMKKILRETVADTTGDQYAVGKANPYRRRDENKALAACLFFESHRIGGISESGWASGYGYSSPYKARRSAMADCKEDYEKNFCECFIIDVNDTNYIDSDSEILNFVTE